MIYLKVDKPINFNFSTELTTKTNTTDYNV